jgi:hypothetical protein
MALMLGRSQKEDLRCSQMQVIYQHGCLTLAQSVKRKMLIFAKFKFSNISKKR